MKNGSFFVILMYQGGKTDYGSFLFLFIDKKEPDRNRVQCACRVKWFREAYYLQRCKDDTTLDVSRAVQNQQLHLSCVKP